MTEFRTNGRATCMHCERRVNTSVLMSERQYNATADQFDRHHQWSIRVELQIFNQSMSNLPSMLLILFTDVLKIVHP